MRLINKLEKTTPWLKISHLPIILVCCYFIFFILINTGYAQQTNLTLNTKEILHTGEYWRFFTFAFLTQTNGLLWLLIYLYVQWIFGNTLESAIGANKFTLMFLITALVQIAISFFFPTSENYSAFPLLVLLAYAFLYPEFTILLFFILPVKAKWIARFTFVMITARIFISDYDPGALSYFLAVVIPYLLFFIDDLYYFYFYKSRRIKHVLEAQKMTTRHRHQCKVCSKTDISAPHLEFRYIETPNGTQCYCTEHLPKQNH